MATVGREEIAVGVAPAASNLILRALSIYVDAGFIRKVYYFSDSCSRFAAMRRQAFSSRLIVGAVASALTLACAQAATVSRFRANTILRLRPIAPGADIFSLNGPNRRSPRDEIRAANRSGAPAKSERASAPGKFGAGQADNLQQRLLLELFKRLKSSKDDLQADGVAGAIERVWLHSGSDTADLLMNRALVAMHLKKYPTSLKILDAVVAINPAWAEGWNQLATLKYLTGDYIGAMTDCERTLALEPRHFGALAEVGFILRIYGDKKDALAAFRRVLAIYPRLDAIRKIVDKLDLEVNGRDI